MQANLGDKSQSIFPISEEEQSCSPSIHSVVYASANTAPEIYEPIQDIPDDFGLEHSSSRSRTSSLRSVKSHRSGISIDTTAEPGITLRRSSEVPCEPSASPSAASFLSTLKSKAGDKQALGNTARETMRKWGVNWTNLKKELGSEESGDIASKLRNKMDGNKNRRASYASVRAAVAERRDRERSTATGEEGDLGRAPSLENGAKDSCEDETHSNPLDNQQTGKHCLASSAVTSNKASPSVSRINTDTDATDILEDGARPIPIRAQPQAKVMMIPGIHASHRGEVMSMGSVPPQPNVLSETVKLKNPTIQSVYRLWSRPVGMDQNLHASGKATGSETDISTSPSPSQTHKLIQRSPPPLPPRKFPGTSSLLNEAAILESTGTSKAEELESVSYDRIVHGATLTTSSIDVPPPLPPRHLSSTA